MFAALFCLLKSLLEDFVAEAVALDIHLRGGKTVYGTCRLEVHVAKVVFITKDIGKDSVLVLAGVLDEAHCDTANRALQGHTCIHKA